MKLCRPINVCSRGTFHLSPSITDSRRRLSLTLGANTVRLCKRTFSILENYRATAITRYQLDNRMQRPCARTSSSKRNRHSLKYRPFPTRQTTRASNQPEVGLSVPLNVTRETVGDTSSSERGWRIERAHRSHAPTQLYICCVCVSSCMY